MSWLVCLVSLAAGCALAVACSATSAPLTHSDAGHDATTPRPDSGGGLPQDSSTDSSSIDGMMEAAVDGPVDAASSDARAPLTGIYTVNVQSGPAQDLFTMWSAYSSSSTLAAFQRAKDLGFNTVRIPVAAVPNPAHTQPGDFDFPVPNATELGHLTDACNQAASIGMRLHIALFDHWAEYGHVDDAETWAGYVIGAIKASHLSFAAHPADAGVFLELQNESPWTFTTTYTAGFDSGYTGVETDVTLGQVTLVWAQAMIPWMRTKSGGTVTTSTYDLTGLTAQVQTFTGAEIPDWYEWHSYPTYSSTPSVLTANITASLTDALAAVDGGILYIGETGLPDNPNGLDAQVEWFETERTECRTLGLPEPAPWQLYDTEGQAYWGLLYADGGAKPAGQLYITYPPGTAVP